VGDRSTDCTAAIQAAIDNANASGGGTVFLPDGYYRAHNLILKAYVTLQGATGTRPYTSAGARVGAVIESPPGTSGGWVIDSPSGAQLNMAIRNLGVRGAGAGSTAGGIRLQNSRNGAVSNVSIDNCAEEGLWVVAGVTTRVSDVLAVNCLLNRTRTSATGVVRIGASDCYVDAIEATASMTIGAPVIDSNTYIAALQVDGASNFVMGGQYEISDIGVRVTGSHNRFVAGRADLNNGHGWVITGGRNNFIGCTSLSNGSQNNTYDGFNVGSAAYGNNFIGCNAHRLDGKTFRYCFNDAVNNGIVNYRNNWVGCRAGEYATGAYNVNGFLGSGPVASPHPIRPASGTTDIDVTATTLVVLSAYTSPTTVTNFSGGVVGQTIRVLGDSDVTIANNVNIQTNTGADKTLASNKVYTFTFYNGKWYEGA
jgi:hypothetical protein